VDEARVVRLRVRHVGERVAARIDVVLAGFAGVVILVMVVAVVAVMPFPLWPLRCPGAGESKVIRNGGQVDGEAFFISSFSITVDKGV